MEDQIDEVGAQFTKRTLSTEKIAGVVAVTDQVKEAGAVTWWRLSGSTDVNKLGAAWIAAGLDPKMLMAARGPEAALRRAVRGQQNAHLLIRPLRGGGWALVRETVYEAEGDLTFDVECKVHLSGDADDLIFSDTSYALANPIERAYNEHRGTLSANDVSAWLVKLVEGMQAVGLRDRGGIYFIPSAFMPQWRKMVEVIRSASVHQVFELPALATDQAVEAILDALEHEIDEEATELEEMLLKDELGARALITRAEQCRHKRAKAETYRSLLGEKVNGLTARLETLEANLAAAALVAGEEGAA